MAIRTKENLIDKIADEHAWRIKEIAELKNLVGLASLSHSKNSVLCRSGVALLYAHWEGFVKKVGSYFLEYISLQRLQISELKSNFITLMLRNSINAASESKKFSTFDGITEFLLHNTAGRARVPYKNIVDTQGNLSTTVLKEISWCLGIDYSQFESKEKLIDSQLVGKRNHIAHGEELIIDSTDFLVLADEVLSLMNVFKNLVENAAVSETYKKT